MSVTNVKIAPGRKSVQVTFQDNHVSKFHASWLRYNCQCDVCTGGTSGCYLVEIINFPDELFAKTVSFDKEEDQLILTIEDEPFEGHVCQIEADYLRRMCYCDDCLERKTKRRHFVYPNTEKERLITVLNFDDSKTDPDEFYFRWMKTMFEKGLCQVMNFPSDDNEFIKIAEKLGPIELTPYAVEGYFTVIRNKIKGKKFNCGNTSHSLPLHMDYPYTECSGHMSLHNCISFDPEIEGGESVVVDVFEAAEILRKEHPDAFQVLREVPLMMENLSYPRWFQRERYCICVDYHDQIVNVCFASDYPLSTQVHAKDVDRFFVAFKTFMKIIKRPELQVEFRHKPKAVVCFNNMRFVHSRNAFRANGGERHFRELCVTTEWMRARYMHLAKKLGKNVESPKLANFSSF